MKKSTPTQKMRWIAGVLYLLLAFYQVLILSGLLQGASLSSSPFTGIAALALAPLAVAMGLWMFASDGVFGAGTRRAVVMGTAWLVLYEIVTYNAQTMLINVTFTQSAVELVAGLANQKIWLYFFLVFRLLLMILAAFFVTGCRESAGGAKDDEADERADMSEGADMSEVAGMPEAAEPSAGSETGAEGAEKD
jgi:hypothetical protein